jgi:uncharacterized protein YydD (DUF2326 family)
MIENQKNFLQVELTKIKHKIIEMENNIKQYSDERADIMKILQTHGAL